MSKPNSTTKAFAAALLAAVSLAAIIYVTADRSDDRPSPTASSAAIPDFSPDPVTSWFPDRPTGDDFLPPESGPGPVMPHKDYPYVPNNEGQPTYRVADLSNPILQPWVVEQMKKANDEVIAGEVPFVARERCWPAGVPAFQIFGRVRPVYFMQTENVVYIVHRGDAQVRRVYMNVPHTANPTPSWYGESVGRYEGDELVVDTIALDDRTFVDNYRTPHTEQLHVVERFKLIENSNILQVDVAVEDPGAFTTPWRAVQRFKRYDEGGFRESVCAENNYDFFHYTVAPIPRSDIPDF